VKALSDFTNYPATVDPNNPYRATLPQRLLIRASWALRDASYWLKDRRWHGTADKLFRAGCWVHR
jgi:hypothetical protein